MAEPLIAVCTYVDNVRHHPTYGTEDLYISINILEYKTVTSQGQNSTVDNSKNAYKS